MKKWETPMLVDLAVSGTEVVSDYITTCNWDGAVNLGLGNEEYTDPNNKPEQHPTLVWCQVHGRWHPKDHSNDNGNTDGVLS